jgi:hypothetical protein
VCVGEKRGIEKCWCVWYDSAWVKEVGVVVWSYVGDSRRRCSEIIRWSGKEAWPRVLFGAD